MSRLRVNLSFNKNNEDAMKAYKFLEGKNYKTEYIVNAVLNYEQGKDHITIENLTDSIKEVLKSLDLNHISEKKPINSNDMEDDVLDMFTI